MLDAELTDPSGERHISRPTAELKSVVSPTSTKSRHKLKSTNMCRRRHLSRPPILRAPHHQHFAPSRRSGIRRRQRRLLPGAAWRAWSSSTTPPPSSLHIPASKTLYLRVTLPHASHFPPLRRPNILEREIPSVYVWSDDFMWTQIEFIFERH
jgi:hypothetical protein